MVQKMKSPSYRCYSLFTLNISLVGLPFARPCSSNNHNAAPKRPDQNGTKVRLDSSSISPRDCARTLVVTHPRARG
jgi:hypothetical protein